MKRQHIVVVVLLSLLGSLAYVSTLQHDFVWDDNFQIVKNPFLHHDEAVIHIFTTDVWGYTKPGQGGVSNYYRPLQMLCYRWISHAVGLDPFFFHLTNVILHVVVTLLCYLICWYLTQELVVAAFGAALFALHPIHTEAVAWIGALPELGCALFMLLSFLLFLMSKVPGSSATRARGKGSPQTWQSPTNHRGLLLWAGSLVSFSISLLWKEMALSLPILVASYQFIIPRRSQRVKERLFAAIQQSFPYIGVVVLYLIWRYQVLGFISRRQQAWELNPIEFTGNGLYLIAKYWMKLILPLQLNSFHVFDPVRFFTDIRILSSIGFLVVIGVFLWKSFRAAPLACFLTSWVFLSLVPVLNITGVGINVFAERYLYIPSFGFCLLLTWLVFKLGRQTKYGRFLAFASLVLLAIWYGSQGYSRNKVWKNDLTLYSQTVLDSPNSALIRNAYAQVLSSKKKDTEGAEGQYWQAIEIANRRSPKDLQQIANAYGGLGGIYAQRGQYEKALEVVEKGLDTGSYPIETGIGYGLVLMHLGRLQEATSVLQKIHEIYPNDELVLDALGVLALGRQEFNRAIIYFKKAVNLVPDFASARNNLGRTYIEMRRFAEALPHLQKARFISPNDPVISTNLSMVLAGLGRPSEARQHLEHALKIAPDYQAAKSLLEILR